MTPTSPAIAPVVFPAAKPPLGLAAHGVAGRSRDETIARCRVALRADEPSVTGTVWVHRGFPSSLLGNQRDIWVYLPPGYEAHGHRRYPVLYMHDGNNLFSAASAFAGQEWGLDETAEYLIGEGALPPIVIVGVANTEARADEYTWAVDEGEGGRGPLYGRFLVEELRPFINAVYKTRKSRRSTAVMGSSLGGLASLYLGATLGEHFGLVGAMSPSVWWAERQVLRDLAGMRRDLRVWLDMGSCEGDDPEEWDENVENARELAGVLLGAGYALPRNFYYLEAEGAGHNEAAWGERAAWALQYLFAHPAPRPRA